MASAYPTGEHETWADCRALLPHAQKVLAYDLEEREPRLDRARIAHNTSSYLLGVGKYAAAEKICRSAVVLREDTWARGPLHARQRQHPRVSAIEPGKIQRGRIDASTSGRRIRERAWAKAV